MAFECLYVIDIEFLYPFQFPPGEVDAADISDYFIDIVRIEIIAEEDGVISNLKVKICREGIVTYFLS